MKFSVADWQQDLMRMVSHIAKSEDYPFEHFYRYAKHIRKQQPLFHQNHFIQHNFWMFHIIELEKKYCYFSHDKIVYPLLVNLQILVQDDFETTVIHTYKMILIQQIGQ